ncbi:ATP-binding protein [Cohaesibacter intestini]|uniref:ATP-binding protein n=1 Tax=Cohaesibacter intestini TaxID=2211145 RepID=UPI000DEA2B9F|nr:HAMP domain-containing sensor histidine kinase [Cohaesibacter intestini]
MSLSLHRWRFFLNSIAGQLMLLLLLATGLLVAGTIILLQLVFEERTPPPVIIFVERQLVMADMLRRQPPEDQVALLQELSDDHKSIIYRWEETGFTLPEGLAWGTRMGPKHPPASRGTEPSVAARSPNSERPVGGPMMQTSHIPFAPRIETIDKQHLKVTLYFKLPDGRIFSISTRIEHRPPIRYPIITILGAVGICMILLMLWAFFFLVRPIRQISQVADHIALEGATPHRAEVSGPSELRGAAKAMNRMQDRIHQLLEDRTRMLAAVGHDLRTPVTRLRLRADLVKPDDMRDAFLRDIHQMDDQLSRLLTFFKGGQSRDDAKILELSSLVESLVDQWSDAGYEVSLALCEPVRLKAQSGDLARMIDNLIDNAIKYAGQCALSLTDEDDSASLCIIDHGPGIGDKEKGLLTEPFARGDEARTLDEKSGFGLGLAIAQQVADAHDAELLLRDTVGGGLTVEIRFPKIK